MDIQKAADLLTKKLQSKKGKKFTAKILFEQKKIIEERQKAAYVSNEKLRTEINI